MRQKVLSLGLAVIMLLACLTSVMSAEVENNDVASITISFNEGMALSGETVASGFEATSVKNFFEDNEINYDYYKDWLYKQETEDLESVTITVLPSNNGVTPQSVNSVIQGDRMVYVDRNYHYHPKTNQFIKVITSLASIIGITAPDTYFGTDRVRQEKEYYVNDDANRVVTKFVELYAPVSGKTQWYAWGYAEGDYVRHGVQHYYKGLEVGSKKNVYHQYYTENYYRELALVNLVKEAYSRGRDYREVADAYASSIGGYTLFDRNITAAKYLEYDNLVIN